jgi:hypothetical protein
MPLAAKASDVGLEIFSWVVFIGLIILAVSYVFKEENPRSPGHRQESQLRHRPQRTASSDYFDYFIPFPRYGDSVRYGTSSAEVIGLRDPYTDSVWIRTSDGSEKKVPIRDLRHLHEPL